MINQSEVMMSSTESEKPDLQHICVQRTMSNNGWVQKRCVTACIIAYSYTCQYKTH